MLCLALCCNHAPEQRPTLSPHAPPQPALQQKLLAPNGVPGQRTVLRLPPGASVVAQRRLMLRIQEALSWQELAVLLEERGTSMGHIHLTALVGGMARLVEERQHHHHQQQQQQQQVGAQSIPADAVPEQQQSRPRQRLPSSLAPRPQAQQVSWEQLPHHPTRRAQREQHRLRAFPANDQERLRNALELAGRLAMQCAPTWTRRPCPRRCWRWPSWGCGRGRRCRSCCCRPCWAHRTSRGSMWRAC